MTLSWTASCTGTSSIERTVDPIANPKAACPVPLYPTDAAWAYRDGLPADTPAQREFRDWTARIIRQQELLDPE
ncbi:MAG: hypothetical protein U0794_00080 [Isosphaeraceae bacterium]